MNQNKKLITVHKFGGSSVGSAQAIKDVIKIIHSYKKSNTIVVVSAMYGVTNEIIKAMEYITDGDIFKALAIREHIFKIHHNAVDNLFEGHGQNLKHHIAIQIDNMIINTFSKMLLNLGKRLSQQKKDNFIVLGEKLAGLLVNSAMNYLLNKPCKLIDPQNIIHVEGEFGNGIPNLSKTEYKSKMHITPLFKHYSCLVMPGFFGGNKFGNRITLGRGGSDLSCTVIGHALNADKIYLWKVECEKNKNIMTKWTKGCIGVVNSLTGVYTQTIPFLDYQTATEMFKLGKKVIHPKAIEPAKLKNIPIIVKNTIEPEKKGTTICSSTRKNIKTVVINPLKHFNTNSEIIFQYNQKTVNSYKEDCSVVSVIGNDKKIMTESKSIYEDLLKNNNIDHIFPDKIIGLGNTLSIFVPKSKEILAKNLILRSIYN